MIEHIAGFEFFLDGPEDIAWRNVSLIAKNSACKTEWHNTSRKEIKDCI